MSKFQSRKSWRDKLENEDHSKTISIPPGMQKSLGSGTMLIPKPLDVDALIRKTKKGQLITQAEIRSKLARDNQVDTACPITTGIFVRIAAEAAAEDLQNGKKRITPYWRVVTSDGGLNEKFPGGAKLQARRLKEEGHIIERGEGKRPPKVKNFQSSLIKL
ncbi:MAG TPA: MGMT family protein [Blastocatellia bacterium]|nr:MGMT family protein [Blastocatellia bacterium]